MERNKLRGKIEKYERGGGDGVREKGGLRFMKMFGLVYGTR